MDETSSHESRKDDLNTFIINHILQKMKTQDHVIVGRGAGMQVEAYLISRFLPYTMLSDILVMAGTHSSAK